MEQTTKTKKFKNSLSKTTTEALREAIIDLKIFIDLLNTLDYDYSQQNISSVEKDKIVSEWLEDLKTANKSTIEAITTSFCASTWSQFKQKQAEIEDRRQEIIYKIKGSRELSEPQTTRRELRMVEECLELLFPLPKLIKVEEFEFFRQGAYSTNKTSQGASMGVGEGDGPQAKRLIIPKVKRKGLEAGNRDLGESEDLGLPKVVKAKRREMSEEEFEEFKRTLKVDLSSKMISFHSICNQFFRFFDFWLQSGRFVDRLVSGSLEEHYCSQQACWSCQLSPEIFSTSKF